MDFEKENIVSIFTGEFNNKNEFQSFVKESFTEDGDLYSELIKDLHADFIDNQFQEVLFLDGNVQLTDFEKFSYAETFMNQLDEKKLKGNGLILLYNFDFSINDTSDGKLKFLGSFQYR